MRPVVRLLLLWLLVACPAPEGPDPDTGSSDRDSQAPGDVDTSAETDAADTDDTDVDAPPCAPPTATPPLRVSAPDLAQGAVATYTCDEGHDLVGSSTRTCGATGWSGTEPTCVPGPCTPNPCAQGAACTVDQGVAVCACPAGFTGDLCEIDVDDCQGDPCAHGGTCTDAVDASTCACHTGWAGPRCGGDTDDC
ncbi:MAG: hypothetical protein KC656_27340, partial [Myxococcales bacterium]|nr:hypothetical protein [Myxococcales bacterium]